MNKSEPINIAILGFGNRAEGLASLSFHKLALQARLRVVGVVDPQPARRQRAAEMFGPDCRLFESADDFYANGPDVDGIWVLGKESTHADLAVPALERGIPVIVEKPLATNLDDAYRICEAHERNPVPFVVPHSLRYLASYRKVKELVESGALGRVLHVHAVEAIDDQHTVGCYRRGPCMYRRDTAFLLAKCSHDLDLINWMMGGVRARSVVSFGGADYFKPRPDLPALCSEACFRADICPFVIAGRLGPNYSAFVRHWMLSELMPPRSVDNVEPVKLSDPLAWETVCDHPSVPWFVSGAARAKGRDGILYFGKTFTVETPADYVLHLGHDGGVRLFLDGRSVATQSERRNPCTHDRTQARVNLSQGTHEIVIAFDTDHGNAEGICFSLEYAGEGEPVFPLECALDSDAVAVDEDTTVTVRKNLCAWNSGSEQVDHQTVIIQYEDGTTADFTLDCFSGEGRTLKITGSDGVVYATPASVKLVTYHPQRVEEFGPDRLPAHEGPHGGGDAALILDWLDAVTSGKPTTSATPHESAEAVALCVGAEVSMLQHRIVNMADLRKERPGQEVLLTNP